MPLLKKISLVTLSAYLFFGFLFWHFAKEMLQVRSDGWYVGQVNLYGDLAYHLSLINKFLTSKTILIDNPIYAGDKINYPLFADYTTSIVSNLTGIDFALFITTILGGIVVLITTHLFVRTFTKRDSIWLIALCLFFLNGGFGFTYFLHDFAASNKPFISFLFNLPREYTDLKDLGYWWINSYLAYFLPQRGFLFAFPITLITLLLLYSGYRKGKYLYFVIAAMLAGTLPLVQAHSLFVIFILTAFYAPLSIFIKRSKKLAISWLIFAVITTILAYPLFKLISSVENPIRYIRFDPGWTSKENFLFFWLKNLGLFGPVLIVSILWCFKNKKLLILYCPFLLIFIISNIWIFQPWEFDNSKFLIYWFFASCILVGYFLYETMISDRLAKKIFGIVLIIIMVLSGSLDIWRTFTKVSSYQVYTSQDISVANQTKLLTPDSAVFVTASNHNNPIPTLSGRSTIIGFHGWVWSHGIDYLSRASEVSTIYQGGQTAENLIKRYKVSYVTVGPQEEKEFSINLSYFKKYPQISLAPGWILYDVSNLWSDSNR